MRGRCATPKTRTPGPEPACSRGAALFRLSRKQVFINKIQKCEDSPRSFGRGGREGWRAAPRHEVSLRRKGQQKPAAWTFGRGGTRGCAPSIQEIQKFEFFLVRGRLLRGSCWGGGRSRARSSASERRSCQREPCKARRVRLRMKAVPGGQDFTRGSPLASRTEGTRCGRA